MDTPIDTSRTTRDTVGESPMIVFPDLDADELPTARHPFDAAERVLTTAS